MFSMHIRPEILKNIREKYPPQTVRKPFVSNKFPAV